ncbi:amidohydrolase 2 (plasmid) [Haloterrigena turkmenica DSM 5511]|uniref:Amidohydrolase 2 n=1 Tax=Haloterrigena turkmenica (strain ATCC 51198 / DSM 5511 / JCM 9101 / NCIMB 13204 / VKM B-1734 / 4k) TaxID=543526 RepID=D2S1I1_HALTV|nr:amidohydrolase family protein [Haloterrigena turkmenica]ADB63228.1 amidohydrolase 2 [Haloterrigena turkmenica DSM 5511]
MVVSDGKIIDVWCNVFTTEGTELYYESQAQQVAARIFGKDDMYDPEQGMSADEFVSKMDEHGIDQVFVPALKFGNPDGGMEIDVPHEMVAELASQHPDRIKGMAGINPREGMDGVATLEEYVEDYGFVAALLEPYGWDRPINHRQYYPFYAKCAELGVPVMMQVGHSAMKMPSKMGKPLLLDDIALDFPELDIVGGHTGWPWSKELEALAWKHDNLYLGATAHAPKYWEENVVNFIKSRGRDKVVFGTDYPVLDYPETLEQIDEMGLDPAVERKLLYENARDLFGV